jgi:carboxypeptidase family protein
MRRLLLALALSALATPAAAQTIRGALTGTVTDSTGGVVPGASVTATNRDTGISDTTVSNTQGTYTFPLMPPGAYQLAAELQGFKRYVRNGVVIEVAQTTRVDIALQIGAVSESILVTGTSPLVRSTTSELGQVIPMKTIQALPLNGRFFEHLITTTPGAMPFYSRGDSAENASAAGARIATAHSVNGMPWSGNNYLLDGVANNEPQNAYINITPPLEAIQEFKVQTNNPTAEFGVFGGAAVNLTIRSGTNDWHGSAFDYLRNDALNAKSYFATTKAPYSSQQPGGTFGGPIVKSRAFFFGDYQGLLLDAGRTQTLTVPTASMRQGDFSEIGQRIFDPITGQPFAGNVIPSTQLNPIAVKVANIYPLPNQPGLANNYIENNVVTQDVKAGDFRSDVNLADRGAVFGRYSASRRHYDEPAPGNIFMGANNSDSENYNGVVGYTRPFGGNKFYELRVGYNKYFTHQYAEDAGVDENNILGIPNGNLAAFPETTGIASFRPTGFASTGSPGTTNAIRVGRQFLVTNNFSWLKGRHALKVGEDLRLYKGAVSNPQTQPQGRFSFDANYTSNRGASGTGFSFASFMLGLPNSVQRDVVNTWPEVTNTFLGLFAQDDIHMNQKLSVQLGVRWDLMTPPVQADNRQSNFSIVDGLIHVASDADKTAGVETHHDYVAPRLGVAYTPDNGKTAVRAAFGISYFADNFGANGGTNERNYPFFQQIDLNTPTTFTPFRSISDGLPLFTPIAIAPGSAAAPPTGFAVFYIPAHFHADTATMWNVGLQRELRWNMMGEVAYVGTRGTNLFRSYNINVPDPGPGAIQARRPFFVIAPTITTINMRDGDGKSWYDALQMKLDKRFSHGLQALVSYTYSKTTDNITPASLAPQLANVVMPALSKTIDIPHIFVASWTYEIPTMSRGGAVAKRLTDGWTISGMTHYHSGDPLDIRVSSSQLNNGGGNWVDQTCSSVGMPQTTDKWFDTSCFANPAQYQFGNYTIGNVRGPAVFNTDVSAAKRTAIGRASAEIRIDVFNVFNRAHFANPATTFGNATFGTISSTRLTPREAQVGFRLLF